MYITHQKAQATYKLALRQVKNDNLLSVSNDFHDYLIENDLPRFCHSWSVKFGDKKYAVSVDDGPALLIIKLLITNYIKSLSLNLTPMPLSCVKRMSVLALKSLTNVSAA